MINPDSRICEKGSGGGGAGGRGGRTKTISADRANLQTGDYIRINTRERAARGTITKINRTTIDVTATGYAGQITYRLPISALSGGQLARGNQLFDVR